MILLLIFKMCSSSQGQQVDADVQAWPAAAAAAAALRVALANGRVHGGEVEQVSQRSAALAWWSADAESDSQPEERVGEGEGRGRGSPRGMGEGVMGGSQGWWENGVEELRRGYRTRHRALRQLLVTCYGYRWQEPTRRSNT